MQGKLSSIVQQWIQHPDRRPLLIWNFSFFSAGTVVTLIVALRYLLVYHFPLQPLGIAYTIAAFVSHFSSALLILSIVPVTLFVLLLPYRKLIIPLGILLLSLMLTLVILDSQLYSANRFHFSFLTIRILGITTWGFGIIYFLLSVLFSTFLAKMVWERHVIRKKRLLLGISIPMVLVTLLFTHLAHIWADATGYVPITRFTTTLPYFYPSTDKKKISKIGISINDRRLSTTGTGNTSDFLYPVKKLQFSPPSPPYNILIIAVDGMRNDIFNEQYTPQCFKFGREHAVEFTNHWSGGNSTRMGLFSLFYGIAPTYQPFIQTNKISSPFIDRLLEQDYQMGIFSSYRITIPASLDLTAFVKVPHLRLETVIDGESAAWRYDSAITDQWKNWLDTSRTQKPFFGFLFYDELLKQKGPPSYLKKASYTKNATLSEMQFARYKVTMMHVDSLIGAVLADLDNRDLVSQTLIIITGDHGLEFDDNHLGFNDHGTAFSDYQLRVPLIVAWPGRSTGTATKRTCHNDICATIMQQALGCTNDLTDYTNGTDLFSSREWEYLIAGSYFNNAIIEPQQVTIQYPTGYFEVRDHHYQPITAKKFSNAMAEAFNEMGRFFRR